MSAGLPERVARLEARVERMVLASSVGEWKMPTWLAAWLGGLTGMTVGLWVWEAFL